MFTALPFLGAGTFPSILKTFQHGTCRSTGGLIGG